MYTHLVTEILALLEPTKQVSVKVFQLIWSCYNFINFVDLLFDAMFSCMYDLAKYEYSKLIAAGTGFTLKCRACKFQIRCDQYKSFEKPPKNLHMHKTHTCIPSTKKSCFYLAVCFRYNKTRLTKSHLNTLRLP